MTTSTQPDLTPNFHYIAPDWTEPQSISMDHAWASAGLTERGTNHFIVGAPSLSTSPVWSRFDPLSPLYQAWVGAYVVSDFQYANEWTKPYLAVTDIPDSVQRVLTLATVDQLAWLTAYGDPSPKADVVPSSVAVMPIVSNYFGIYCRMESHSDVGAPTLPYPWYPPPSNEVDPFAPITLHSTAIFKYIKDAERLVVAYSAGVEWHTKGKVHHSTPVNIYVQQALLLAHMSVAWNDKNIVPPHIYVQQIMSLVSRRLQ